MKRPRLPALDTPAPYPYNLYVYHFQRYMVKGEESYTDLIELLERAWADLYHENAYPENVTLGPLILIKHEDLLVYITQAPDMISDAAGWDAHWAEIAKLCRFTR